jgi:hypothetical protein
MFPGVRIDSVVSFRSVPFSSIATRLPNCPKMPSLSAEDDPEDAIPASKLRMLLVPLVDRELPAQGRILQSRIGPGQKRRQEKGDERGCQCFHKVSERIIKGRQVLAGGELRGFRGLRPTNRPSHAS